MGKKVDFRELSSKRCSCCGKPLKQNLVSRSQHAELDYICFMISKGVNSRITKTGKRINYVTKQKDQILKYKRHRK